MSTISKLKFALLAVAAIFLTTCESKGCYDDELIGCAEVTLHDEWDCSDYGFCWELIGTWYCENPLGDDKIINENSVRALIDDEYGLDGYTVGTVDIFCMEWRPCADVCQPPVGNQPAYCVVNTSVQPIPWDKYRHTFATGSQCHPEVGCED